MRRSLLLRLLKKDICWIWWALDRATRRVCGWTLGRRDTQTAWRFVEKLPKAPHITYCTDYYSYTVIFPKKAHLQSKKGTQTIESHNGRLRHYLARLRRKTKCYSKSLEMLEASLILFFARKMPNSILC